MTIITYPDNYIPALLWLDGWEGKHSYKVLIAKETPKRYYVMGVDSNSKVSRGKFAYVPKYAVTVGGWQ